MKTPILPALLALSLTLPAVATDRLVPDQYATVQAAIDAAAAGDVVQIAPGAYPGPIDTKGKSITVRGTTDAATTIVSGGESVLRCVSGEQADCIIENLTFTAGTGTDGAGIRIVAASPTLRACRIVANTCNAGGRGAGVAVYGGQPAFFDCLIASNTGTGGDSYGGGVHLSGCSARFTRCNITGNTLRLGSWGRGGGVYVTGAGSPRFDSCAISGNDLEIPQTPGQNGGFCGGAGTAVFAEGPVSFTDCAIRLNANFGCGSGNWAVHCATNQVTLSRCEFCGNTTSNIYGAFVDLGGNTFSSLCGATCPSDLNGDGVVNGIDLGVLLGNWGTCVR
jgi:hypothetical protein